MLRLVIANDCQEQVVGQSSDFSQNMAIWSLRALWHIENNDIIVLPIEPTPGYLEYITELTHVDYQSLRIIIAPPGIAQHLTPDRLQNPELCLSIKKALAGRKLDVIVPLIPDAGVVALARLLDAENCLPGAAFASQGGGVLANSKIIFRAIAAGSHTPIPKGFVTKDPQEAKEHIKDLLIKQNVSVIIKKDFGQGCRGNEVLTNTADLIPNGGRRGLVLTDATAIENYVDENWNWLTNDRQHGVVIEEYFPHSRAIFAEFKLSDQGVEFAGIGEMLALPIADGQVVPPIGLSATTMADIISNGGKLCAALHAIGYRGMISADAIVTADNTVYFNEFNGRVTGSTHIYATIGARIVGKETMANRVLLERRGWIAASFQEGVTMLRDSGLAYDPKSKSGIILSGTYFPGPKIISYTIVAENLTVALQLEKELHQVSPRAIGAL